MTISHTTRLLTCHVAGTSHHLPPGRRQDLHLGTRLGLVREPGNDHDPDAIAVLLDHSRIGYVPQRHNTVLARLLDAGMAIKARVEDAEEHDDGWMKVVMAVELVA